jgi:hypothetical protein
VAAAVLVAATSCGKKEMKVTDSQMDELIKKEIPIGSSSSQVVTFVDALNINSIKAINHGYMEGSPGGTLELKGQRNNVKGYLVARLPKVGRDPSQFQVYEMRVIFYFGAGERLIDYKIETMGDW